MISRYTIKVQIAKIRQRSHFLLDIMIYIYIHMCFVVFNICNMYCCFHIYCDGIELCIPVCGLIAFVLNLLLLSLHHDHLAFSCVPTILHATLMSYYCIYSNTHPLITWIFTSLWNITPIISKFKWSWLCWRLPLIDGLLNAYTKLNP